MVRLRAPFGEALLEITTASAVVTADAPSRQDPALPAGMRVDDCRLQTISISSDAGEVLSVVFRLQLKDGWTADFASGESLDAFEITSVEGASAAVGMRDPEWLCRRLPLKIIDASDPRIERNNMLVARYQVLNAGQSTSRQPGPGSINLRRTGKRTPLGLPSI
jgi:hypothetical protein